MKNQIGDVATAADPQEGISEALRRCEDAAVALRCLLAASMEREATANAAIARIGDLLDDLTGADETDAEVYDQISQIVRSFMG